MRKDINWYLLCKIQESVNVDVINSIIELGATVNAINPYTGESALIMATRKGNFDLIHYILERTKLINHKDKNGITALMYASESGNRYVVQLFIEKGADIYLVDSKNMAAMDYAEGDAIKEMFAKIIEQKSVSDKKKKIYESDFILYDHELLEKELEEENNERRGHYLNLLNKTGPIRELKKINDDAIQRIQCLVTKFPNFKKAIQFYIEQLHLCNITDERYIEFKPLLLTGVPGVGKTQFCNEVASALNSHIDLIQCGSVTAGFALGGGNAQWSGARPGKVHTIIRDSHEANPIILLDEIDKMSGSTQYDCYGSLYSLLEKNTAKKFIDELIELPMDCSRISWIATANCLDTIPEPIRSRFSIVKIREPNKDEVIKITNSIYSNILRENKWGKRFSESLDEKLITLFANISPRDIKSVLISSCGKAVSSRKCDQYKLIPEDINLSILETKSKVGFTT
jgi:ATP-dependent Lon protease